MLVFALPVNAALRFAVRMVLEGEERRDVVVGNEPDVAAVATIAAVGSTHDYWAFTPETDAARAAIASLHVQLAFVDELRHGTRCYAGRGRSLGR